MAGRNTSSPAAAFPKDFGAMRAATWNIAQLLAGSFSSAGLAAKRRRLGALLERNGVLLLRGRRAASGRTSRAVVALTCVYWGALARHAPDAAAIPRGGTVAAVRREWVQRALEVRVGVVMRAPARSGSFLRFAEVALAVASVYLDTALPVGGRMARRSSVSGAFGASPR